MKINSEKEDRSLSATCLSISQSSFFELSRLFQTTFCFFAKTRVELVPQSLEQIIAMVEDEQFLDIVQRPITILNHGSTKEQDPSDLWKIIHLGNSLLGQRSRHDEEDGLMRMSLNVLDAEGDIGECASLVVQFAKKGAVWIGCVGVEPDDGEVLHIEGCDGVRSEKLNVWERTSFVVYVHWKRGYYQVTVVPRNNDESQFSKRQMIGKYSLCIDSESGPQWGKETRHDMCLTVLHCVPLHRRQQEK